AGELYVHSEEQEITMNTNAACNLERLVQRLETATLRLEALGAQKPMLAPKPTRNNTPPPTVPYKNYLSETIIVLIYLDLQFEYNLIAKDIEKMFLPLQSGHVTWVIQTKNS
uniref:Reverse transcriptase domain-containing protein n=1 Tax=Loa loa TaxID=7209 RepID=A0A1I7V7W9_LOALO